MKAITPLASSMLLLLLAIGLGAVVMSWGNQAGRSCDEVEIAVTSLHGVPQACLSGTALQVMIENNGLAAVDGMNIGTLGDSWAEEQQAISLSSGQIARAEIPLPAQPLKVRLIPLVNTERCIAQRIELENIRECP